MRAAVLTFCLLFLSAGSAAGDGASLSASLSHVRAERLIAWFSTAVTRAPAWPDPGGPISQSIISKWTAPIWVGVYSYIPDDSYSVNWQAEFLSSGLWRLSKITGLPIVVYGGARAGDTNLDFFVNRPEKIARHMEKLGYPEQTAERATKDITCTFDASKIGGDVSFPLTIFINRRTKRPALHHCMMGNFIAALGLPGIFTAPQRSFDKIDGKPLVDLSVDLQILIRTLYDPRIKNDMPVAEAIKLAQQIIPELVQAVDQNGISALVQP